MAGQTQTKTSPQEQVTPLALAEVPGLAHNGEGSTATLAELLNFKRQETELLEIQKEEAKLRLAALKRDEARREERESQDKRIREEGARIHLAAAQAVRKRQETCQHRKENGRPHTGGVRAYNGQITVSCGNCSMEWSGTKQELYKLMPEGLVPNDDQITGPVTGI